jgi:hypothetical protein
MARTEHRYLHGTVTSQHEFQPKVLGAILLCTVVITKHTARALNVTTAGILHESLVLYTPHDFMTCRGTTSFTSSELENINLDPKASCCELVNQTLQVL